MLNIKGTILTELPFFASELKFPRGQATTSIFSGSVKLVFLKYKVRAGKLRLHLIIDTEIIILKKYQGLNFRVYFITCYNLQVRMRYLCQSSSWKWISHSNESNGH